MSLRFDLFPSGVPPADTDLILIARADASSPTGFSNYLLTWAELKATISPVSGGSSQPVPGMDGVDGEDGFSIPGAVGIAGTNGAAGIGKPGMDGEDAESPMMIPGSVGPAGPAGSNTTITTSSLLVIESEIEEPSLVPGPKGDTGATGGGGGGGLTLTSITTDLGASNSSGTFDVTGLSGLTADKTVIATQLASPITSKGNARDEMEDDVISIVGYVLSTTSIRFYWNCKSVVVGNYNFGYAVSG